MLIKDRLLVLLQILQEKTDDETWLTTAQIRELLEAEGQGGQHPYPAPEYPVPFELRI